jgi:hypothetical protein
MEPPNPVTTRNGTPLPLADTSPAFHTPTRQFLGPQIPHCEELTPGQLFKIFFNLTVMTQFVEATNSYARGVGIDKWEDVTIEEMYTFFAVLMVFGISCPPERRMAWDHHW